MSLGSEYLDQAILKYNLEDPWDCITLFENKIAKFTGAKYAISTDCCTHALFLALKYLDKHNIILSIPEKTYISVPSAIKLAGYDFNFTNEEWEGSYSLKPLNIIDSATQLFKNMYASGTLTCLSFHFRKILPIGRGGMILMDSIKAYEWFSLARYDGRNLKIKYENDDFASMGYHMYLTPEQAAYGVYLFDNQMFQKIKDPSSKGYKSIAKYKKFY